MVKVAAPEGEGKGPVPHGVVTFHPFVVRREGTSFILGQEQTRRYVEVGPESMRAIDLMQAGVPWQEVGARLEAETGRAFDLEPFLRRLAPHGFLHRVGPRVVWDGHPPRAPTPPPRAFRLLRAPWLVIPLLSVAVVGVALLLQRPQDVATPGDVLFSDDPLLTILAFAAMAWTLTLGHEFVHYGLARSYGIDAHLSLGTRLHLLVCETDVTNAWKLPRGQRAVIIGGGLLYNLIVLGVAEVVYYLWQPAHAAGLALEWLLLLNVFQLVFQGLVILRTDGYYLIVAAGGERNLRPRAFRALRATLARGPPCRHCGGGAAAPRGCALCDEGRPAGRGRRRALVGFALLVVAGSMGLLAMGLYGIRNVLVPFLGHLVGLVREGVAAGEWVDAAKAGVVLAYFVGQLALIGGISGRKAWRRWRASRERAAAEAGEAISAT